MRKKIVSFCLAVVLLLAMVFPASATTTGEQATIENHFQPIAELQAQQVSDRLMNLLNDMDVEVNANSKLILYGDDAVASKTSATALGVVNKEGSKVTFSYLTYVDPDAPGGRSNLIGDMVVRPTQFDVPPTTPVCDGVSVLVQAEYNVVGKYNSYIVPLGQFMTCKKGNQSATLSNLDLYQLCAGELMETSTNQDLEFYKFENEYTLASLSLDTRYGSRKTLSPNRSIAPLTFEQHYSVLINGKQVIGNFNPYIGVLS